MKSVADPDGEMGARGHWGHMGTGGTWALGAHGPPLQATGNVTQTLALV